MVLKYILFQFLFLVVFEAIAIAIVWESDQAAAEVPKMQFEAFLRQIPYADCLKISAFFGVLFFIGILISELTKMFRLPSPGGIAFIAATSALLVFGFLYFHLAESDNLYFACASHALAWLLYWGGSKTSGLLKFSAKAH